jgi:hypothetical protein
MGGRKVYSELIQSYERGGSWEGGRVIPLARSATEEAMHVF